MVALAAALGLAGAGWASSRQADTLIVLEASTLRAAPMLRGQPVAELEPGAALVPVTERDEWVRARSLHGEEGWVERAITGTI
ncbi:MAG: SH3 domain-containing protein [Gemmatimonadota bacterium]